MTLVYIGLGSNLNNPTNQIKKAIKKIFNMPSSCTISISSLYCSPPHGCELSQPNYINAVLELDTTLLPEELLKHIQWIEKTQGRIRTKYRWDARVLDIDILLFGNVVLKSRNLTIPHYDIKNRIFVLLPLSEIAPNIYLPDGTHIKTLIKNLDCKKIKIIEKTNNFNF